MPMKKTHIRHMSATNVCMYVCLYVQRLTFDNELYTVFNLPSALACKSNRATMHVYVVVAQQNAHSTFQRRLAANVLLLLPPAKHRNSN